MARFFVATIAAIVSEHTVPRPQYIESGIRHLAVCSRARIRCFPESFHICKVRFWRRSSISICLGNASDSERSFAGNWLKMDIIERWNRREMRWVSVAAAKQLNALRSCAYVGKRRLLGGKVGKVSSLCFRRGVDMAPQYHKTALDASACPAYSRWHTCGGELVYGRADRGTTAERPSIQENGTQLARSDQIDREWDRIHTLKGGTARLHAFDCGGKRISTGCTGSKLHWDVLQMASTLSTVYFGRAHFSAKRIRTTTILPPTTTFCLRQRQLCRLTNIS